MPEFYHKYGLGLGIFLNSEEFCHRIPFSHAQILARRCFCLFKSVYTRICSAVLQRWKFCVGMEAIFTDKAKSCQIWKVCLGGALTHPICPICWVISKSFDVNPPSIPCMNCRCRSIACNGEQFKNILEKGVFTKYNVKLWQVRGCTRWNFPHWEPYCILVFTSLFILLCDRDHTIF